MTETLSSWAVRSIFCIKKTVSMTAWADMVVVQIKNVSSHRLIANQDPWHSQNLLPPSSRPASIFWGKWGRGSAREDVPVISCTTCALPRLSRLRGFDFVRSDNVENHNRSVWSREFHVKESSMPSERIHGSMGRSSLRVLIFRVISLPPAGQRKRRKKGKGKGREKEREKERCRV